MFVAMAAMSFAACGSNATTAEAPAEEAATAVEEVEAPADATAAVDSTAAVAAE